MFTDVKSWPVEKVFDVMTKQQEIEALQQLATALGPDSYVGPWLLSALPDIEADIKSDLPPAISWQESQKLRREPEDYHKLLTMEADNHAQAVLERAQRRIDEEMESAKQALRRAMSALDNR